MFPLHCNSCSFDVGNSLEKHTDKCLIRETDIYMLSLEWTSRMTLSLNLVNNRMYYICTFNIRLKSERRIHTHIGHNWNRFEKYIVMDLVKLRSNAIRKSWWVIIWKIYLSRSHESAVILRAKIDGPSRGFKLSNTLDTLFKLSLVKNNLWL